MALTGRAALLAALGALPVGILRPELDGHARRRTRPLALAMRLRLRPRRASDARSGLTRSGDTSVRLGEHADVTPHRHQPLRPPPARPPPRRLAPQQLAARHRDRPPPATG